MRSTRGPGFAAVVGSLLLPACMEHNREFPIGSGQPAVTLQLGVSEIPAVVSEQSFQRLDSPDLVQTFIEPCSKACLTHFTTGVATQRNEVQPSGWERSTQTTSEDNSIHPRQ